MPAAPSASTESQLTAWVARSPAYAATMRRIRPATVRTSSGIAIRKEDASVINVPPLQHRDGPMVRLPSPAPFSNGRPLQAWLVQCERRWRPHPARSEEHTSELQSLMRISYAVFCLKKKKH